MQLTDEQFKIIEPHCPTQRGNVNIPNIIVINALLHVMHKACASRKLPEEYGP